MTALFGKGSDTIGLHIRNVFKEKEHLALWSEKRGPPQPLLDVAFMLSAPPADTTRTPIRDLPEFDGGLLIHTTQLGFDGIDAHFIPTAYIRHSLEPPSILILGVKSEDRKSGSSAESVGAERLTTIDERIPNKA